MTADAADGGLELSPERMRALGYEVIDLLVDRHVSQREQPVWRAPDDAALAALRRPLPEHGQPFETLLDLLVRDVLAYAARIDHPRFLAFVPGAPTWPAVLGDLLAAGHNVFQGTWLASAGVSALELTVLDWFRSWLGYPAQAAGLLLSGGSAANLAAIACARSARFPHHDARAVLYLSAETHSSAARAARILGFADDHIRTIPVAPDDRIDMGALRAAILEDGRAGLVPFALVASAGTTSTGAVDPLPELADLCSEHGLWLHVDAAYGGFAILTTRGQALLRGIERADSIALDPHKWLYQPFEAGCLLVRDGQLLDRAFHIMPHYLQDTALHSTAAAAALTPVNFANRGPQLTRYARVLKIWISLSTFGLQPFRTAIEQCCQLAEYAERRIRDDDRFELLAPARFGIVCFRRRCPLDGEPHESCNASLLQSLANSGIGLISSTRVRGNYALRLCILNYRTSQLDIDLVLDFLREHDLSHPHAH